MALFGKLVHGAMNFGLPSPQKLIGNGLERAGHALNAPELGISEALGVHHDFASAPSGTKPGQMPLYQGVPDPTGGNADGAGGGGGAVGGAGVNPAALAGARNNIYGDQNTLNQLYNSLDGQINAYGEDKRNAIDQSYQTEFGNNEKNYMNANNQVGGAMTGRNISDSSYTGNALDQNKADYTTEDSRLHNAQNENYSALGQTLSGAKAQLGNKPQYDLNQYQDLASLEDLHNQLTQHIQGLKSQQQQFQTGGQLRQQLDSIAPSKSNLASTLQTRLDSIIGSAADPASKMGIANTYISQLPADQQDQYRRYINTKLTAA